MQLGNIKKENNITSIYYQLTFGRISWWELVSMMSVIIEKDFVVKNGKIHEFIVGGINKTKEVQEANYNIDKYKSQNEETGYISISGYSGIIEKNVKYTLWNQLEKFLIEIENEELIEKYGEHIYDRMTDSIELTTYINCTKEKYQKNSAIEEKNKINKSDLEKNMINVECFACNTKFQINCSNIPSNQKTFYWKCSKCNAELKIGNPNYSDNSENREDKNLTDRDKLIKSMQLPSNIRSLSKEEQNEVIIKTIIKINEILKNIQCDNSEYELSNRQKATKNNTLNNIKAGEFLEAYYEITDFADNYGNNNGKVFETEKQEIYNLIMILYNKIKG